MRLSRLCDRFTLQMDLLHGVWAIEHMEVRRQDAVILLFCWCCYFQAHHQTDAIRILWLATRLLRFSIQLCCYLSFIVVVWCFFFLLWKKNIIETSYQTIIALKTFTDTYMMRHSIAIFPLFVSRNEKSIYMHYLTTEIQIVLCLCAAFFHLFLCLSRFSGLVQQCWSLPSQKVVKSDRFFSFSFCFG